MAPADTTGIQAPSAKPSPAFDSIRAYSRFVARAKRVLPAAAIGLLLLVAIWPRLEGMLQGVRFPLPRLDLRDARELQMVSPRYTGIDRDNRPFVVTAATARQKPKTEGMIALEQPKGDMTSTSGNWLELSSDTGLYQLQPQLLDLYGHVVLYQDKGNEFHSATAHLDMAAGTAESDSATTSQGPFGNATSEGFRILDRGDTIFFKGRTRMEILARAKAGK
jgi:lipopolysaccharide export system protein LptC